MKVTPVKQYTKPIFPTHAILEERPELLRIVPKRWRSNPVVISALSGFIALSSAHLAIAGDKPTITSRVAPVFQHGDGYGMYGTSSGPVFLGESEAIKIIDDEAKRAGLSLRPASGESLELTAKYPEYKSDGTKTGKTVEKPLKLALDGRNRTSTIWYEYVSQKDCEAWTKQGIATGSPKTAAGIVHDALAEAKPDGSYGVFYDPMSTAGIDDESRRQALQKSAAELRKQVQDFVAWLKAQGVI